jgi:hypothetical protein
MGWTILMKWVGILVRIVVVVKSGTRILLRAVMRRWMVLLLVIRIVVLEVGVFMLTVRIFLLMIRVGVRIGIRVGRTRRAHPPIMSRRTGRAGIARRTGRTGIAGRTRRALFTLREVSDGRPKSTLRGWRRRERWRR